MVTITRINQVRYLFLALAFCYLLFIALFVGVRSHGRKSILHLSMEGDRDSASIENGYDLSASKSPAIHLQEFHRTEIKDGKKQWEIKAADAKHFFEKGITQANNSLMTLFRSDNTQVSIASDGAKLQIENDALKKVGLEGNVKIALDKDIEVMTGLAFYYAGKDKMSSPSSVEIKGKGFEISGRGVEIEIEPQIIRIKSEVLSIFRENAKMPKMTTSDQGVK